MKRMIISVGNGNVNDFPQTPEEHSLQTTTSEIMFQLSYYSYTIHETGYEDTTRSGKAIGGLQTISMLLLQAEYSYMEFNQRLHSPAVYLSIGDTEGMRAQYFFYYPLSTLQSHRTIHSMLRFTRNSPLLSLPDYVASSSVGSPYSVEVFFAFKRVF